MSTFTVMVAFSLKCSYYAPNYDFGHSNDQSFFATSVVARFLSLLSVI